MLSVENLTLTRGERTLCERLSLVIEPGTSWAILGPNGCGKTTLLMTLAGLLPIQSGTVSIDNKPLSDFTRRMLAQRLGMLFQHHDDSFPLTVYEVLEQACFPHHALWQSPGRHQQAAIENAIAAFELQTMTQRDIRTLSGGERQRVALAGLQVQNPALWLLDEPTNHLDIPHQLGLLKRLSIFSQQNEKAIVMALHDVNQAMRAATHVLLMLRDGKWLAGKTADVINGENLQRLYNCEFHSLKNNKGATYWMAHF